MARLGIRFKVLSALSLSLIVIFGVISFLVVRQNTKVLQESLNERTKSFARLATPPIGNTFVLYKDSGRLKISQEITRFLDLEPDIVNIRIIDVSGNQLFGNSDNNINVDTDTATSFESDYKFNSKGQITRLIEPYIEDSGAHRYSVVYETSGARVDAALQQTVRLILYVAIAVLVVSLTVTLFLMNRLFIRPLAKVSREAKIISEGNLEQTINATRHDEIGDLARAVNAMTEALKADITKLRELDKLKSEFLMITSHNLRTPLSIMKGYIEMAESAKDIDELKSIIDTISVNVLRLGLFAEDVLAISTIESGQIKIKREPVAFKQFIDQLSDEFSKLAAKKKLNWSFDAQLPEDISINMSQHHLRSALGNILDNAIKFTPNEGRVEIKVQQSDGKVIISVTDTGIGIAESELTKLFTKFHRGTSTLAYDYEGVGIGLYLTRLILTQHDGSIEVRSTEGKGSTFIVTLPIIPAVSS